MSVYQIPLTNISQQFEIVLGGTDYFLTVKWNDQPDAGWILDIADTNNNPIVCGLPLITGGNILEGLNYLGFGGGLFVLTNGAMPDDVPTVDNLGTDSNLYFQTGSP